ncbi:hypothetical protein [Nitratireductor pacificus]|uniref:Lipoprotein n=1 Tax=Nitratireductor pacificus pht-3B TaxID=391937 RepID=K2LPW0_9HYPH|nr:hypothetical protein [Nitratireductor pacificus]EKF19729.1 hypothetical protein NA2_07542 [Nitratireductor pacificus pht-3B]
MKFNRHGRIFQVAGLGLLVASQAAALSGCTTASLEDAAPVAAAAGPQAGGVAAAGPRMTGEYPNLNVPPASAATPITVSEKEALKRDLTATREKLGAGASAGDSSAEAARLRLLARTHAQRRLEEIERGE